MSGSWSWGGSSSGSGIGCGSGRAHDDAHMILRAVWLLHPARECSGSGGGYGACIGVCGRSSSDGGDGSCCDGCGGGDDDADNQRGGGWEAVEGPPNSLLRELSQSVYLVVSYIGGPPVPYNYETSFK